MFMCETTGSDITSWKVNGTKVISSEISGDMETDRETVGNNNLFTLTIFARAVYNGTTFQCVTGDVEGAQVESEIVTLTVQGIIHIHVHVACCTYTQVNSNSMYNAVIKRCTQGLQPKRC